MAFPDPVARNALSKLLADAVNDVARDHYDTISQEPALSARIGQRAECLSGRRRRKYQLEVVSQDIPDRGRNSLERKIGADIYFGVRITGARQTITKGFLVQSKWDHGQVSKKLTTQCEDMLRRTQNGAFVWIYGKAGVSSIPAKDLVSSVQQTTAYKPHGEPLGQFFRQVLDCRHGDFDLASSDIFTDRRKLSDYVADLRVRTGIAVSITPRTDLHSWSIS